MTTVAIETDVPLKRLIIWSNSLKAEKDEPKEVLVKRLQLLALLVISRAFRKIRF